MAKGKFQTFEDLCKEIIASNPVDVTESFEIREREKKKALDDYNIFWKRYLAGNNKTECAWYHKQMAQIVKDNPVCNLLASIYRSGAKSSHLSYGIPIWLMFRGEMKCMLLVSKTEKAAKRL